MNQILVAYSAFQVIIGQIQFLIKQKKEGMPNARTHWQAAKTKQQLRAALCGRQAR